MEKQKLLQDLRTKGFSEKIIKAFESIERKEFILPEDINYAYYDTPLSIGHGQTISQPYTIAFMLELLDLKDKQKILEVGSGSGYVLALISYLCPNSEIFGIERIKKLAENSILKLKSYKNIKIICDDGSKGLKTKAPFDRILTSASADKIPENLVNQLKVGGILVAPVKNSILKIIKQKTKIEIKEYSGFVFVPLVED